MDFKRAVAKWMPRLNKIDWSVSPASAEMLVAEHDAAWNPFMNHCHILFAEHFEHAESAAVSVRLSSVEKAALEHCCRVCLETLQNESKSSVSTMGTLIDFAFFLAGSPNYDLQVADSASLPLVLLGDAFAVQPLVGCEELFRFCEQRTALFRKRRIYSRYGVLQILRTFNSLLLRISRVRDSQFAGRILLFLAKVFPFQERSGLNMDRTVNSDTPFFPDPDEAVEKAFAPGKHDEEFPTIQGEPLIDESFYHTFWSLQKYCHNPTMLFRKDEYVGFVTACERILGAFESYAGLGLSWKKLEDSAASNGLRSAAKSKRQANQLRKADGLLGSLVRGARGTNVGAVDTVMEGGEEQVEDGEAGEGSASMESGMEGGVNQPASAAIETTGSVVDVCEADEIPGDDGAASELLGRDSKGSWSEPENFGSMMYLTRARLLRLQLRDPIFWRSILSQMVITFHSLLEHTPQRAEPLLDKQAMLIRSLRDRATKVLEVTPPDGADFVSVEQHLLSREKNWLNWKKNMCPTLMKPSADAVEKVVAKKSRRAYWKPTRAMASGSDAVRERLSMSRGKDGDVRREEIAQASLLSDIEQYIPLPVEQFLQPVLDESADKALDESEKHANDTVFMWKALRLLTENHVMKIPSKLSEFEKAVLKILRPEAVPADTLSKSTDNEGDKEDSDGTAERSSKHDDQDTRPTDASESARDAVGTSESESHKRRKVSRETDEHDHGASAKNPEAGTKGKGHEIRSGDRETRSGERTGGLEVKPLPPREDEDENSQGTRGSVDGGARRGEKRKFTRIEAEFNRNDAVGDGDRGSSGRPVKDEHVRSSKGDHEAKRVARSTGTDGRAVRSDMSKAGESSNADRRVEAPIPSGGGALRTEHGKSGGAGHERARRGEKEHSGRSIPESSGRGDAADRDGFGGKSDASRALESQDSKPSSKGMNRRRRTQQSDVIENIGELHERVQTYATGASRDDVDVSDKADRTASAKPSRKRRRSDAEK